MLKKTSKAGFTLIEIAIALGILSVLTLVITSISKQSINANIGVKKNQEINELIQLLNAELTRVDVCKKNFENPRVITSTDVSIAPIVDAFGKTLLDKTAAGKLYGEEIMIIDILGRKSSNKLTITVQYSHKRTPTVIESFTIGLNVFSLAGSPNVITSCFSDVNDAIIQAVKNACQGTGAYYVDEVASPPYGKCYHKIELQNSTGAIVGGVTAGSTTSFTCPSGEMLAEVLTNTDGVEAHDRRIFKCHKFATNNTCPAWQYMSGIDVNGNATCLPLLTLVGTNGILTTQGTSVIIASVSCPAGTVLTKVSAFGTPTCINPNLSQNCPTPGQYVVSTNADGSVNCSPYPDNNACAAGQYITAINSVGVVTCGSPSLGNSCAAGYVVTGIDAAGNVVCSAFGN